MKSPATLLAVIAGAALLAGPLPASQAQQFDPRYDYRYGGYGSCKQRVEKKRIKGWQQYTTTNGGRNPRKVACLTTAPAGETYGVYGSCSTRITTTVNGRKRTKRVKGARVYQDGIWADRRCALQ